jgi:hypothetical protein
MFSSNTSSAADANFVEDVFSTWLYTGTGATQTITNGIDLAGKGGLVWARSRSASNHFLGDTVRGVNRRLISNLTNADTADTSRFDAFNSNGFETGINLSAASENYVSWAFRKQPKFFDVVTYTGDGTSSQTIAHNLGAAPGFIIVKRTDSTSAWYVSHRSESLNMKLNTDEPVGYSPSLFINNSPTSTTFTVGTVLSTNGGTFVAYLFAHNAGGFGLTGTDNVISCGSYVADGTDKTITLGYEPQWVMVKRATDISDWIILDTQRGWSTGTENYLKANTSGAEDTGNNDGNPTSTGFFIQGTGNLGVAYAGSNQTMLYIAIRKNMKS